MKRWILIAWALTLGVAAFGIAGKERLLAGGQTIYLRLAPVDPRSLMQGDYMALNFAIGNAIREARRQHDLPDARAGVAVVTLDARREAVFVRLHGSEALAPGERLLRYQTVPTRWGGVQVQVSTDAFFFQEGQAARFEHAKYGEFRVGDDGTAVLVKVVGEGLEAL
ncbi:hypothetical protein BKK79_13010 [Cupriavidus sp. USMAA2-4]|uniref:GDYXXLXY domain-containing protein n=1 Tax=Cupriavidus malaysiensis TaxID=367825 RepID=A0ABM6F7V5_9BURK|nr:MULTISPECIES: GDYXXLXY domain-containing protein [Cupriavidus]AOY92595.1 hypothetical protein BKK79_13010 [Cupriavidus sp. USMAA2-4]AOZ07692.1 hypothetical protein BKK80_19035 [Cupriavidus malaysiensis]